MNKKIIFSAGGTGGHIFPAINLMKHFFDKGYDVSLVTDKKGKGFIKNYPSCKLYILKTGTPTNKNLLLKFLSIFIILYSIIKSLIILKKSKPNLIIGFGGYVSFPISYACRFFNIPLVIYEPNLMMGRANKYLLKYAKKVFLNKTINSNILEKFKNKISEVGSILDKNIINYSNFEKDSNKDIFTILVIGGSQGAEIFGKIIPPVIKMIKDKGYNIQINQQCTNSQKNFISDYYKKNNIINYIFEFDKNVLQLFSTADLAITRCGASATAELTHTLTPFVAIPIPDAIDNHQYLNAKFYENKGCCWILEQKNFNTKNLFNLIIEVLKNKNKLKTMQNNMKKIYNNNVYSIIEKEIENFI
jgi:UDP-N-acetylglucosamine--N-acetylmuramyl-(pentapeptide) pyrophosphoryl-undecaprenol N-acetylglucosamine transferase